MAHNGECASFSIGKVRIFGAIHVFRLVFAFFAGRMEKENFGSIVGPKRTYGCIVSVKGSGGGKRDGVWEKGEILQE